MRKITFKDTTPYALILLAVLIPLLKCGLFFDSYYIKILITQITVVTLLCRFVLYGGIYKINRMVTTLLVLYFAINVISIIGLEVQYQKVVLSSIVNIFISILLSKFD